MTKTEYDGLEKEDQLYFVRMMPRLGYYEVLDVVLVTKHDTYCTIMSEKEQQTFLVSGKYLYETLYLRKPEASQYLSDIKKKHKMKEI